MTGLNPGDPIPTGVSVVLCCHNSEKRLPETLNYLAAQAVPTHMRWEIIVVDNASTDGTASLPLKLWPKLSQTPLRVVAEPVAGLNNARLRGIREAHYSIVSLIDDDNWVAENWVEHVAAFFARHPEVGAYGGQSVAATETSAPGWFDKVKGFYAVGRQSANDGDITDLPGTLLWGAGLNLRVAAFRALLEEGFHFFVQDRQGGQLSSGGDTEICYVLRELGWRIWYDDTLILRHFIPKDRLKWSYALRLMRGMGQASVLFLIYHVALRLPPFQNYPRWKGTWPFQFLKALRELVGCFLAHPWQCATGREGSNAAVRLSVFRGRVTMLLAIRSQYLRLKEAIENAKWARH